MAPEDEAHADTNPSSSNNVNHESMEEDERSVESDTFQGAKSDCGFADSIHETLMAAGQAVHSVFGEPHVLVEGAMKETGDFVKDTAVALHDFSNADGSILKEETSELVRMMTSKEDEAAAAAAEANNNGSSNLDIVKESKTSE